jgi:hypothetical protein
VGLLKSSLGSLALIDSQVIVYTVLALIPNLLLILWAMARLSREVRLLKSKAAMVEDDINLLDQSISNLTSELQAIRESDPPIAVAHAVTAKKES